MVVIDFETASEVNIKEQGSMRYFTHPSTQILMLGYKIDNGPVKQIFYGDPFPKEIMENGLIYAFNFGFELGIWQHVCIPNYKWPKLEAHMMQDVQAICGRFGLPQNLKEAAKVLHVPTQKDEFGLNLIKLFCMPPFGRDDNGNILPHLRQQWELFKIYNQHDVEATYQVLKALPTDKLEPAENKIWLMNHEINVRGVPVDPREAYQILRVTESYLEEHNNRLIDLTDGKVSKVTQIARIKSWMESKGYYIESLTQDELPKWLSREDLPDDVMEVLELRAGMGLSSLGKYKRILNEHYAHRMFYNSRYYGAHTGRITGMGLQLLNLPRASVKDPEAEIQKFFDLSIVFENPVMSARALVRPMIKASEGKTLIVADYSSIEFILLMWLCEEHEAVKRFAQRFDQYKDLAVHMYNVPYDEINKSQRQVGKYGILGCGYGLGAKGFVGYADRFGLTLPLEMATRTVNGFRSLYSNVPKFWYSLANCAINAIEIPGRTFETNRVKFEYKVDRAGHKWLRMILPSGRAMYYFDPKIEQGKYGPAVTTWGIIQETKSWGKKYMTPGKWAENVIQALGRDLLYYGKQKLQEAGYDIVFSIYDEVVSEVPVERANLKEYETLMASIPPWAEGLPVRAEGYISNRYKKG